MIKLIQEIRTKDRKTRMRWLIIFSSISGLIILSISMIQFDAALSNLKTSDSALAEIDKGRGIWSSFSAGISDTFTQIKDTGSDAYQDIKGKLETVNEINIEAENIEVTE